jgi:hypothetical protein
MVLTRAAIGRWLQNRLAWFYFFLRAAEVHVRILSNFAASNVRSLDGVEGGRQNPKPKDGGIKDVIKMNSL